MLKEGRKKVSPFAIVGDYDRGHRYIKSHPILKLLPLKWAERMIPKTKVRLTDIIYDNEYEKKLGYIIDVPGFFIDEDKLKDKDRAKLIEDIIRLLQINNIQVLVFPLWRKYLTLEEKFYLEENSIILLDGSLLRLVSLIATVEKLFGILKAKQSEMEVGIWGADSNIGQLWVEFLAPFLNYLTIGGNDIKSLERLSNKTLYDTGLSCQVTLDPNQCLINKDIIILCSIPQEGNFFGKNRIVIFSSSLSNEYFVIEQKYQSGILIESGWILLNWDLKLPKETKAWNKIGALEANLFTVDNLYRDILLNYPMSLNTIQKVKEILKKYGVIYKGMISNNEIMTYDGFRRYYFRNYLDK